MTDPILAEKNELFLTAAGFLMFAGIAFVGWGLISPQQAMFWSKRRTRTWAAAVGLSFTCFCIGVGVYAQTGDLSLDLIFAAITIGLVYHVSKLGPRLPKLAPATNYTAANFAPPPAGGQPPAPSAPPRDSA